MDTYKHIWFAMNTALLFAFSLSGWFSSAMHELVVAFNQMNTLQWGIVSSAAVAFGFMCLKGTGINR